MSAAVSHTTDLPLARARALIDRAIDKAEQIGMRGAISVVGGSGALVSASRMDHGGAGGMARAHSKAWIAATQQIPSAEHLKRMGMVAPPMVTGFVGCSPEAVFPGAGGMPVREDGWVVGGIAASGAVIGPFVGYPGSEPELLIADGRPSNGEDLIVHYALEIEYAGQHGDDHRRWVATYGSFPDDPGPGLGMAPAPPAARQTEHGWARGLADAALDEAQRLGHGIAVAIVDSRGDPVQQDRADGAPTASVTVAQAVAATAATFQCPSQEVAERYRAELARLADALPFAILAVPGGLPIVVDGETVGGIGIGGPSPGECARVAAATLAGVPGVPGVPGV
jgi:uncharacterized protein GlcG (DUF336 family)